MPGRIEDYALIGDMQSAALVGLDGSVDWLCLPRFDSPAFFAALLGDERNGHWTVAPAEGGSCTRRRYRGDTPVLETEWSSRSGTVRVVDFMPPRGEAPDVVRIVEGVSGRVDMRSTLRLRFDYGHIVPWVRQQHGQLAGIAGPDAIWLRSEVPTYGKDMTTYADFTVSEGERVSFVLTWHPSHLAPPKAVDAVKALAETERFWSRWISSCTYDGPWRDAVARSLVTLKSLTYAPTGGIVAAATTSLPEALGGERNWDYRYCWLRDATMTLQSLLRTGFVEEAKAWREWLLRAIAGSPADLQIMYGVAGERRLTEYEIDWLPGYEGARPVRIGNGAVNQLQLDVYGEVVDALYNARHSGLAPDDHSWGLQQALVGYLEDHWDEPDEGIWEVRGGRKCFTHSRVMAWVGLDRAVRMVEAFGREGPVERWRALREEIHAQVCREGWNDEVGAFTQFYGSKDLDAALLLLPQVGFLPPEDPRVVSTVEAVQRELSHDGLIRRYGAAGTAASEVDGLGGEEGAFIACSFWLADDLALIGRQDEARAMFERLLDLRNDVGLLAEEYDATVHRQVGNVPQAYSHVALINTALHLSGEGAPHETRTAGA